MQISDDDLEIERLLRGHLIKAHLSDEDTDLAFSNAIAGLSFPDRVVTHEGLPRPIRISQSLLADPTQWDDRTGGLVWGASDLLVEWILREPLAREIFLDAGPASMSVLELGGGAGMVSIALALLGVESVVMTDGDLSACEAARVNAVRNGVTDRMQSACLCWGREADSIVQLEETLRLVGRGGRCAQVIVAADVLYRPESTEWLAQTLRDLIGRGGCTHVVLSWRDRGGDEEEFLSRLSDLGTAKVVWAVSGEGIRKKGVSVLTVGELQHPAI